MGRNPLSTALQNFIFSLSRTRNTGYVEFATNSVTLAYDSLQVEQAVREIKRLLIEASAAALQAEMRNPTATSGRYSVL